VAEVLLPALTLSANGRTVHATLRNAAWDTVFSDWGAELSRTFLGRRQPPALLAVASAAAPPSLPVANSGLDDVLPDPGNRLALAACRRVVEAPGLEHNPLYLHGPAGCGKSHLLQAVADEFIGMLGEDAALLIPGEALAAGQVPDLAGQATVILVDGLESLADRALAQEHLFHLVNATLDRGAQLVVAGRVPPKRLPGFEDRLISRLSWGLTVGIETAHLETRVALVRRLAGRAAEDLPADRLAAAIESQAPDLAAAARLGRHLAATGALPTGEDRPAVSFERIVQAVAERFDLRPRDIASKRRHREIVLARGISLMLGRELTGHSLKALGGLVGGRDHATVINALRSTEARLAADPSLRTALAELRRAVAG
jgi:chromosomal replication initiator protein